MLTYSPGLAVEGALYYPNPSGLALSPPPVLSAIDGAAMPLISVSGPNPLPPVCFTWHYDATTPATAGDVVAVAAVAHRPVVSIPIYVDCTRQTMLATVELPVHVHTAPIATDPPKSATEGGAADAKTNASALPLVATTTSSAVHEENWAQAGTALILWTPASGASS